MENFIIEDSFRLTSKRLLLRKVELNDLNDRYIAWMNDIDVTQFTDIRFKPQNRESLISYWESITSSTNQVWLAICLREGNQMHIGNIKLGPINYIHSTGEISLFIGDKACHGKGYGLEVINLLVSWAFSDLCLYKVTASIYQDNEASIKAFKKAGFALEGVLRQEALLSPDSRSDILKFGLLCSEHNID